MKYTDKEIVDKLIANGEPMYNPEGHNEDFCIFCNAVTSNQGLDRSIHDHDCPWRMAVASRNPCKVCDGDGLIPAYPDNPESTRLIDCNECNGTGIRNLLP